MARRREHRVLGRLFLLIALALVATSVWAFLAQPVLIALPVAVVAVAMSVVTLVLRRRRRVTSGWNGPDAPGGAGAMKPLRPRNSPPSLGAQADPDLAQTALA